MFYKVTGGFTNGHQFYALVAEEDYADFLQNYQNSRDDGAALDPATIVTEQVDYQLS